MDEIDILNIVVYITGALVGVSYGARTAKQRLDRLKEKTMTRLIKPLSEQDERDLHEKAGLGKVPHVPRETVRQNLRHYCSADRLPGENTRENSTKSLFQGEKEDEARP